MNCYLLFFILALTVNNTFDEREAESEGIELAQLYDILTIMAKIHACYTSTVTWFHIIFYYDEPSKTKPLLNKAEF